MIMNLRVDPSFEALLGTLTFLLLGTAEEQTWNRGEYDKSVGASAEPQPRQETTTVV